MPRIAAALAVLGTVAFCIGFNTVRYPVVWEMLTHPGSPPAAQPAEVADTVMPAKSPPPAAKSIQPSGSPAKPAGSGAEGQSKAARLKEPDPEPEFCTADGICHIAVGPKIAKRPDSAPLDDLPPLESRSRPKDSPPELPRDPALGGLPTTSYGAGVSPALSRGGQTPATPRGAETPASSRAGRTTATSRAGETPAPQPQVQRNPTAPLTLVRRPLVPVLDGAASQGKGVGAHLREAPFGPFRQMSPDPFSPSGGGTVAPAGDAGVRPLPPVEERTAAAAGFAQRPLAYGSSLLYPTTGYAGVDLDHLKPGNARNLVPVGQ